LLVTANVVSSSPILVSLMMEALHSSGTSVLTKASQRNIPEDGILQNIYCCIAVKIASFMMNGVFWDVTLCGSGKNRRFGETPRLLHQGDKNR
jgi:hypothetical protein